MSDDIELPDGPLRFVSAAVADALAARVEELGARIARALVRLGEQPASREWRVIAARRILRGDDQSTERTE